MSTQRLSRRAAVRGAAIVGVGTPLLAACGADDEPAAEPAPPEASSSAPAEAESSAAASPEAEAAAALTTASEIPVGGGKIFSAEKVVVVQPTAGEFKAFSAVCPHQACLFTEVTDNTIKCGGCHQSEFDAADGANTVGPNGASPNLPSLDEVALTVDGDAISLA